MKPCDPNRLNPAHCSRPSPVRKLALAGLLLASIAPLLDAQTRALLPRYRFKMMLDGPGNPSSGGFCTVIDDFGRIATDVSSGGMDSLVRTDGTTTELIADTSGPIAGFVRPHALMQMNSSGTVAFCADMDAGGQSIFTWDGATLTEVMHSTSLPWSTPPLPSPYPITFYLHDLSINASGSVACLASRSNGYMDFAIFLNDGASTSEVVMSHFTSYYDNFTPGYLRLLDDGTIATNASGSMAPRGWRCDPLQSSRNAILRLSPFGDILEMLASTLTDDTLVAESILWSANSSGQVIYRGGCTGSQTMVGASAAGQFVIAASEAPGSWDDFGGASISNSGRIAFLGITDGGNSSIVADGSDPVRNRVLGTGDVIFGKTVQHTDLRFRDAINDAGQICLAVFFTDGTKAIVRADPRLSKLR